MTKTNSAITRTNLVVRAVRFEKRSTYSKKRGVLAVQRQNCTAYSRG